jgi:hypothetical protein
MLKSNTHGSASGSASASNKNQDPDPHQFADDKLKRTYGIPEPISALFHRFDLLFAS